MTGQPEVTLKIFAPFCFEWLDSHCKKVMARLVLLEFSLMGCLFSAQAFMWISVTWSLCFDCALDYTVGVSSSQCRAVECAGSFINSSASAILVIYGKLIPVVIKLQQFE